jgi:hypothetical protein
MLLLATQEKPEIEVILSKDAPGGYHDLTQVYNGVTYIYPQASTVFLCLFTLENSDEVPEITLGCGEKSEKIYLIKRRTFVRIKTVLTNPPCGENYAHIIVKSSSFPIVRIAYSSITKLSFSLT